MCFLCFRLPWENNISEWTGLKFCDALRESENKIKWRELQGPWRPNGHHDYGIGARCKVHTSLSVSTSSRRFFLSLKEKLKRKRIKDDKDITKDKLDNNEGKVYPMLHIFY